MKTKKACKMVKSTSTQDHTIERPISERTMRRRMAARERWLSGNNE